MSKSVEGIYRDGKIELEEVPGRVPEGTRVTVTFPESLFDLRERGIDEAKAGDLRSRLSTFVEDWDSPEMDIYDNYDAIKRGL